MKTGIELIAQERDEQINKHRRSLENDVNLNNDGQLLRATRELLQQHPSNMGFPHDWDKQIIHRMASKPLKERLVIAGALIAAEIDRIQNS